MAQMISILVALRASRVFHSFVGLFICSLICSLIDKNNKLLFQFLVKHEFCLYKLQVNCCSNQFLIFILFRLNNV